MSTNATHLYLPPNNMNPHLTRRQLLSRAAIAPLVGVLPIHAEPPPLQPLSLLAATWRGPLDSDSHHAGVLRLDPEADTAQLAWKTPLPTRAHGLLPLPGGELLVLAVRPGRWLMRIDAQGRPARLLQLDDEPDGHRIDGHALLAQGGRVLLTPQTDREGRAWLALRDPLTLALLDRWPGHGTDPHHLLLHPDGSVMLALGGIRRTPDGRKTELERMASALVQLDGRSGALRGRWTLPDPRLSLRHLAWALGTADAAPRLGIGLQAEHADAAARAAAPLLAWWDGQALHTGLAGARHAGYAGDIAAAAGGGWVLSAQFAGRALAWLPGSPPVEATVAELRQPCALAASHSAVAPGAVWLAAATGAARWHPRQGPRLLRWPEPMVLDNHWVAMPA